MTKEKLSQIFNELLMREPDTLAESYLDFEEDFVRKEIGKSKERWQIIKWVNILRRLRIIKGY